MSNEKTAIFVDGAFFIRRAYKIFGPETPDELANKLWSYLLRHIYPMHNTKTNDLPIWEKLPRNATDPYATGLKHISQPGNV